MSSMTPSGSWDDFASALGWELLGLLDGDEGAVVRLRSGVPVLIRQEMRADIEQALRNADSEGGLDAMLECDC